ncbi:MAG: glycoside hydrolase family 3 protein [Alphaproteobacteria bacterium]|nr:glycoside hydrolase family 3 protein [Alphaproteobacteria bacterium]
MGFARRSTGLGAVFLSILAAGLSACGRDQPQAHSDSSAAATEAEPLYKNASAPIDARAADLVARLTLQEKAEQLGYDAPAIKRLGVPKYNWWNEGLHGVARAGNATVFPQAIGMAATWDASLMRGAADVISTEFRAKYLKTLGPDGGSDWYRGLTVWSPNINIFRDPRWGRGQETYGEDPYLTSQMAVAFIHGLQGDDPKFLKTIATAKHFAVHSGPESNRHREDVHPSPHDLEDTYLPAFRAAVVDGGVESVMCAYNAIDGVPACADSALLEDRLRKDWGFKGYVVSDCGAAANIYRKDALHYVDDPVKAVSLAFTAGMDIICGDFRNNWTTETDHIVEAVKQGLMKEAVIDKSLERLFAARMRLGMFEPANGRPFSDITAADYDTDAHRELAARMARESMVLLKNDGLLPFRASPKTIAVIGPNADSLEALVGNYHGIPSKPVTVLDGLRARFPNSRIIYAEGTGVIGKADPAVPDEALCVDPECKSHGLKAEYFDGGDVSGEPRKTAVEQNAAIMWSGAERNSSIRWSGALVPSKTGAYQIRFDSRNGYRIWIGDRLLIDAWDTEESDAPATGSILLEAGKTYPIRIEARQVGQSGYERLVWNPPGDREEEAVAAAASADVVVFVAGLSPRVEGEEMRVEAPGFSGGDRTSLDLPAPQEALLRKVVAAGKPVVLVLMNGSALGVNWADAHVGAIIEAWYPGEEGGSAVASLLAGDYSPAGRLPVTFYKSVDQLPDFENYAMTGRTYKYFTGEPLYPFGYGLSYTSFSYANAKVSSAEVSAGDPVTVSAEVTNTGAMDGDEVVELYLAHPGVKGAPIRSLEGFKRIHLKKGETKTVEFSLSGRAMSVVDSAGRRRIDPGTVEVWIGGGQPVRRAGMAEAAGVQTKFEVSGSATVSE